MRAPEPPRPTAEEEALGFATWFFRSCAKYITVEGGKLHSIEMVANMPPDERDKHIKNLGGLALIKGDLHAIEILCGLAARYIAEGKPLPESLLIFTCLFLRHPFTKWRDGGDKLVPGEKVKPKPGPRPRNHSGRNHAICAAIETIVIDWGFAPTRNAATGAASAASIVRDGLEKGGKIHLTEVAINKIWNKDPCKKKSRD